MSTLQSGFTRSVSSLRGEGVETNKERKTSIICTIGPKVGNKGMLGKLLDQGMNVMRLNFSHGSYEYHGGCVAALREALAERPGKICAIALDTKGPEIRTGKLEGGADVKIEAGAEVVLSTDEAVKPCGTAAKFFVDYKDLPNTLKPGMSVYIDDGLINLEVVQCSADAVTCVALNTGMLGEHKGVNLPGAKVTLPAVSEKDQGDLRFGVEQKVDMIFASFIRTAKQVQDVRAVLGEDGKHIKIFSKIENQEGLDNFDAILAATDGVMVARGDLGIEIPPAKVFVAQKSIIRKCNLAAKPVIVATQMLESMVVNPRPTRAEVSDVGNAIVDGADCVMLSGETAKGKYPLDAVRVMDETAREAESFINNEAISAYMQVKTKKPWSSIESMAFAACNMSFNEDIKMIVVIAGHGEPARLVSKYRPKVPVFVITDTPYVARQAVMSRGLLPILVPEMINVAYLIQMACLAGKSTGVVSSGDKIAALYLEAKSESIDEGTVLRIFGVE